MKRARIAIALLAAVAFANGAFAAARCAQDGSTPAPKPAIDPPKPAADAPKPAPKSEPASSDKPAPPITKPPAPTSAPDGDGSKSQPAPSTKPIPAADSPNSKTAGDANEKPSGEPVARADRDGARASDSASAAPVPAANGASSPGASSPGATPGSLGAPSKSSDVASGAPNGDVARSSGDVHAAAPKTMLHLDGTRALDAQSYDATVERLALEFPDLLRVQSLGKSRAGRDLWLLTASDTRAGDAARKPALCVCSDLAAPERSPERRGTAGPEAALFALAELLAEARARPEIALYFQQSTLYVMPSIDPDAAIAPLIGAGAGAGDAPPRECCIDRNFPVGWQPWGDAPGAQGPYPLSEPESQNAARFFTQRANVSALLLLTRDALERPDEIGHAQPNATSDSARDEADELACERVCASVSRTSSNTGGAPASSGGDDAPRLEPPARIAMHAGDLALFCERFAGLAVFATAPWGGTTVETTIGPAPAGFEALKSMIEHALKSLPRLAAETPSVERLRNNLWMVELGVRNVGILPTLGARERERGTIAGVTLKTTNAKLVGIAVRRTGASSFQALRALDGGASIGQLDGDESARVRLLVEAPENTTLELALESPRAGQRTLKIPLQ